MFQPDPMGVNGDFVGTQCVNHIATVQIPKSHFCPIVAIGVTIEVSIEKCPIEPAERTVVHCHVYCSSRIVALHPIFRAKGIFSAFNYYGDQAISSADNPN